MRALVLPPFVRLKNVPHDDFGLDEIWYLDADGTFAGNWRQHIDALGLERGGDVVVQAGNLLQLDPGRGMQFVAGDSRPLGDVAQGNFDVELRQRLLDQARVGHQFLFRFRRLGGDVGKLQEIQRRQGVIANFAAAAATAMGLGLRGAGLDLGGAAAANGSVGLGFARRRFLRRRCFLGIVRSLGLGRRGLAQNISRRGSGDFFGRNDHAVLMRGGLFCRLGRWRMFSLAITGLALRDAQVADGRFRNRAHIGAQSGWFEDLGAAGFAGFLDLFLQFAGLLFQVAGAPFQFALARGHFGLVNALRPELAAPFAQLKICQVDKADKIGRAEDNGRADFAHVMENVLIEELADDAAHIGGVEGMPQVVERAEILFKRAGQAHAAKEQDRAPEPAPLQIGQELEKITQAKDQQQDRDHESANPENPEELRRHPRSQRATHVVRRVVDGNDVDGRITLVISEQGHHEQERGCPEHDANDIVQTMRRRRPCVFASHKL